MARKPRVEYAGAVYHVMNRGDRGGKVFLDLLDYELFLAKLAEVCGRTGWRIHSYVLMPNHFHWLLETPEAKLVDGMKWFLGAYSQGFNARHGQRGHVFQGRYKALPVETGSGDYLETVSTYIHLNPARARLLDKNRPDLAKYRWSSYPSFVGSVKARPAWLETGRVLGNVRLKDDAEGRKRYEEYIAGRIKELRTREGKKLYREVWNQIRYGWCFGGQGFQEKMLELVGLRMEGKQRESYSGDEKIRHDEKTAEKLLRKAMKTLGADDERLQGAAKGSLIKCALAWYIHKEAMVSRKWISGRLQMGCASNLTTYINRIKTPTTGDALKFRKLLSQI